MSKAVAIRKLLDDRRLSPLNLARKFNTTPDYVTRIIRYTKKGQHLRPDQIRYKKRHPKRKRKDRQLNYEKGAKYNRRSGEEWNGHEDEMILNKKGKTDRQLARQLGRTVRAIQIRRSRLINGRFL